MSKTVFISIMILSAILMYKYDWNKIIETQNAITEGPQRLSAKEMFQYIITETPQDARIIFAKPRALALFTGRECFAVNPEEGNDTIQSQVKQYRLNYILTCRHVPDKAIKEFITGNSSAVE